MSNTTIKSRARQLGLYVDTYNPGDGETRYRFFDEDVGYFEDDGIFTALGSKEAHIFLDGVAAGKVWLK